MKDIGLPEFRSPEDIVDLHDIVKRHAEQDSTWTVEITQVERMTPTQIQQFMEHSIKARVVLQRLSAKIIKDKEQAVEVKEILSTPMDQHRCSYANTCEDLFIKWSEYEKSHPLQENHEMISREQRDQVPRGNIFFYLTQTCSSYF
jgi:hypothetical protein